VSDFPDFKYTIVLRTDALDEAAQSLSNDIAIVHLDLSSDRQKAEDLISQHDIVLDLANSREVELANLVLAGTSRYKAEKGRNAILLHLSGAGNFSDDSTTGVYIPNPDPFDDTNEDHVRKINSSMMPNGAADEVVINAAAKGEVNAYIVCPGAVYGTSKDHFALRAKTPEGQRYARSLGVWTQWMFDNIVAHGYSPWVGPGTAEIATVHVDDVVSLTVLVLRKALSVGHSYQPEDVYRHFYLAVVDSVKAQPLASLFAYAAYRLKLTPTASGRSVQLRSEGDNNSQAPPTAYRYLAGNVIVKAGNGASLGWKPVGPGLKEALLSLPVEID
jgi:nucleoside-diphosphate-sugar epimerase